MQFANCDVYSTTVNGAFFVGCGALHSTFFLMPKNIQGKNFSLHQAKREKNDEFYTQLPDIENELKHYRDHFKNKVVFCNCDDPYESNFFKYFALNFNYLGLKKLIAMGYATSPIAGSQVSLFEIEWYKQIGENKAYKLEIYKIGDIDSNGAFDLDDIKALVKQNKDFIKISPLQWDQDFMAGDFRSSESIKLLQEADIVVTNPPFSLFREYVALLVEHGKKFVILGNMNAITYKEIFPLIQANKLWTWYGFNMSMIYKTIYPNLLEANRKFVLSKWYDPDEGYLKVPGICWYTNLETQKRHEELVLYKTYNTQEYPKYDNYDAINVDKVVEIPSDYEGIMGVPITFLDKYNPNQFEIIELSRYLRTDWMSSQFVKDYYEQGNTGAIHEWHPDLCYYSPEGKAIVPYMRILICKKKQ